MPKHPVLCQCEIYQTCEVCREQTERDLATLRKRDNARVANDVIPALQTENRAQPIPLREFEDRVIRAMKHS